MNKCFFTAQLAVEPKKSISKSGKEFIKLLLRVPNTKKGQACFYLNTIALGQTGMFFWQWYNKGDYLVFEGYLKISKFNRKKNIVFIILQEHPIFLDT